MNIVNFKTSNYFNGAPYLSGIGCILVSAMLLLAGKYLIALLFGLCGSAIITAHYRLSVNFLEKSYREDVSVLGLRFKYATGTFANIVYLFIKKSRVSQRLNSRVQSTTIYKWHYDAYLKFSEEEKVHLMTLESKLKLIKKLENIAHALNTKIIDYSDEQQQVGA